MSQFLTKYFSTFIVGTEKIIEGKFRKQPGRIRIISLHNGLVIYESNYSLSDIQGFKFFNNSFLLLEKFNVASADYLVPYALKYLINSKGTDFNKVRNYLSKNRARTFKITVSLENQTAPLIKPLIEKLENKIVKLTKLKLSPKNPDVEFWILIRSEKFNLFGIRIIRKKDSLSSEKGQLKPELAHILCYLSQPSQCDVFLDPFSGNGAIPMERLRSFPFKKIISAEIDNRLVSNLKRKIRSGENVIIEKGDALNLANIKNDTIDKIVTDPPWGFYKETSLPIQDFYQKMLQEFYRIIKPNGIVVILIGNKLLFEDVLGEFNNKFILLESHNILVSGKKASIYKIKGIGK